MERALYNTVLAGMELTGKRFFYVNPLEVVPGISGKAPTQRHDRPQRPQWYACACCPPNVARLLSSIGCYAYSAGENTCFHLYLDGAVDTGLGYRLSCETAYPVDGQIAYTFHGEAETTLAIRIPAWSCQSGLAVNGENVDLAASLRDGYAYITRRFRDGDQILLTLDMTPRKIYASTRVPADTGCAAVQRGPLVYCLEEADNGPNLHLLRADNMLGIMLIDKRLPEGQEYVEIDAVGIRLLGEQGGSLYDPYVFPKAELATLRFIPYYLWANREEGERRVWLTANERPKIQRDELIDPDAVAERHPKEWGAQ